MTEKSSCVDYFHGKWDEKKEICLISKQNILESAISGFEINAIGKHAYPSKLLIGISTQIPVMPEHGLLNTTMVNYATLQRILKYTGKTIKKDTGWTTGKGVPLQCNLEPADFSKSYHDIWLKSYIGDSCHFGLN